ncbi:MAG: hypothetical protein QMD53_06650 [Actinomycetota bacterium]|nr:hypothetical protein [Actinomycetota bacterium]
MLVRLFNEFGANDVYGQGFPSRWCYAEEKIRSINGTEHLPALIRSILDPREWLEFEKPPEEAVVYLNDYLKFDGFEITRDGEFFGVVLIFFMQAGFMLVETGFCRSKNAAHMAMTNFVIFAVGTLSYYAVGFALQFGGLA